MELRKQGMKLDKSTGLTLCLLIGQLMPLNVFAQSREAIMAPLPADMPTESLVMEQDRVALLRLEERTARPLSLNIPRGREVRILFNLGYGTGTSKNETFSTMRGAGTYRQDSLSGNGPVASLGLAYGITKNIYAKAEIGYSSQQIKTERNDDRMAAESYIDDRAGISEPTVTVGTQFLFKSTRLFGEIGVEIPAGERTREVSGATGKKVTSNNLLGGPSAIPRLGVIQDFGPVLWMTDFSYTVRGDRTLSSNTTYSGVVGGVSQKSTQVGGNEVRVNTGIEFKRLWNLGMSVGYLGVDSSDTTTTGTLDVRHTDETGFLVAETQMGIKLSRSFVLIPKVAYKANLKKERTLSDGTETSVYQNDLWNLSLGTRFAF